jgi:hypothetical protein
MTTQNPITIGIINSKTDEANEIENKNIIDDPPKLFMSGGYQCSDYKSVYDEKGYQCSDYKSVYE